MPTIKNMYQIYIIKEEVHLLKSEKNKSCLRTLLLHTMHVGIGKVILHVIKVSDVFDRESLLPMWEKNKDKFLSLG